MALVNESMFLMYRRFLPITPNTNLTEVTTPADLIDYIESRMNGLTGKVGLLLSSGMDSAILAKFLPPGSIAYTFDYGTQREDLSEFHGASFFVKDGVTHKRIEITKERFYWALDEVIRLKQMPAVPHEAAIYLACLEAKKDGVDHLATGVGADGRFGGFSHFYKDRTVAGFKENLHKQFVSPQKALVDPVNVDWVFEKYMEAGKINVQRFLLEVGTEGTAVTDVIRCSGLDAVNPYTELRYAKVLADGSQAKGFIKSAFDRVYPGQKPNKKYALPVPYGAWIEGYTPSRPEFRKVTLKQFGGKRFHQVYSLERYMDLKSEYRWVDPYESSRQSGFLKAARAGANVIRSLFRRAKQP